MERDLKSALAHRRSYYSLEAKPAIGDAHIEEILEFALNNVPSAFNSQSTRMVLLLGENHKKLWNIVKDTLKARLSPSRYPQAADKIENSFACGYGTVLYFEDEDVIKTLQKDFPSYKDNFPKWSMHTAGMHQLAVWTMLEDAGFGASLQHYNPIIDDEVRKTFALPESWQLIAQMPFGTPLSPPDKKEMQPIEHRLKVLK